MSKKVRIGKAVVVENTGRKKFSNADTQYTAVLVKIEGEVKTLLLTDGEIRSALTRAFRNPEDTLEQSWVSKLID